MRSTPLPTAATSLSRAVVAGSALLLAGLLAACGAGGGDAPAAVGTPAPASTPAAQPVAPVALPWPAASGTTAGGVAALQSAVDGGSQPWLLDPVDLAESYATAVHHWPNAEARSTGPDLVEVSRGDPGGPTVRLTVAQPGRTGKGGIWVVTGEQPG